MHHESLTIAKMNREEIMLSKYTRYFFNMFFRNIQREIILRTRITSWILPGPLLPKKPKAYTSMGKVVYVPVNSKTAHAPPPRQTPGHLTFLKNFGQIPRYVASETVKCPTRLSFKEGQIPHPPGMLKQLWNKFCKIFSHYEFLVQLVFAPHFKHRYIPRKKLYKTTTTEKPTWNRQEQWPVNAAHVLNQRIAKSFCFRPLTDV